MKSAKFSRSQGLVTAAVVMAGGASSRLFPYDKVLSDLCGSGKSMMQEAFLRATSKKESGAIDGKYFYIVTGKHYRAHFRKQIPQLETAQIITEPERRNTLPAILYAVAHIQHRMGDTVAAVLTADHVIRPLQGFRATLNKAVTLAGNEGAMVTMAITPSRKAEEWIGFGALKTGPVEKCAGVRARPVRVFQEKPSLTEAKQMIAQGGHYWNSGMFIFRISTLEAILKRYQPVMFRRYKKICEALRKGKKGLAEAEQIFLGFPKKIPHPILPQKEADNSIDFALMVPLTKDAKASVPVYAIPADFEWHDIGAWDALRKIHRPSQGDNICVGKVRTKDVCSSILVAEKGLELQAKSFSHVIAVATQDKLLLISDSRAQEVKKIFEAYTASLPHAKDQILECGRLDLKIDRGNVFALGVNGLSVRRKGRLIRIEAFHS